jgi:hypothetical protein
MEYAELPQDRTAIIVNPFTGQTVVVIKRVHAAEGELNTAPRRGKAAPAAEVCAANHDFNENGVFCDSFCPGGIQTTSPGRISSTGPSQACTRPLPAVTINV